MSDFLVVNELKDIRARIVKLKTKQQIVNLLTNRINDLEEEIKREGGYDIQGPSSY